jgi:hypothetical protein
MWPLLIGALVAAGGIFAVRRLRRPTLPEPPVDQFDIPPGVRTDEVFVSEGQVRQPPLSQRRRTPTAVSGVRGTFRFRNNKIDGRTIISPVVGATMILASAEGVGLGGSMSRVHALSNTVRSSKAANIPYQLPNGPMVYQGMQTRIYKTDAGGNFFFENLKPGEWILGALDWSATYDWNFQWLSVPPGKLETVVISQDIWEAGYPAAQKALKSKEQKAWEKSEDSYAGKLISSFLG